MNYNACKIDVNNPNIQSQIPPAALLQQYFFNKCEFANVALHPVTAASQRFWLNIFLYRLLKH